MLIVEQLDLALVEAAEDNQCTTMSCFRSDVSGMQVVAGQGITGVVSGELIGCGNASLMSSIAPGSPLPLISTEDGGSVCYVAKQAKIIGGISVSDVVRKEAKASIKKLKELGVACAMLTGGSA